MSGLKEGGEAGLGLLRLVLMKLEAGSVSYSLGDLKPVLALLLVSVSLCVVQRHLPLPQSGSQASNLPGHCLLCDCGHILSSLSLRVPICSMRMLLSVVPPLRVEVRVK